MKKRLFAALLSAVLLTAGTLPAFAAETDNKTEQEIVIQDEETACEEAPITAASEPTESDMETAQRIDVGEEEETTQTEYAVNPLYQNAVGERDLLDPQESPASSRRRARSAVEGIDTYTEDKSVIARLIRSAMRDHTETLVFKAVTPEFSQNTWFSYVSQWVSLAMEETDSPIEGDYIRWNYAGFSGKMSYHTSSTTGKCEGTYTLTFTYYTTPEQEAALTEQVDCLLDGFSFTDSTSDYTKIQTIYDYVCHHVTYDNANLNDDSYKLKYTAYAALINKTAVCQGYASLIYRMVKQEGISSRIIASTTHGWNIVQLDGKYYYLDATWDSETPDSWKYFLCGEQCSTFFASSSHTRSDGANASQNTVVLDYTSAEFYRDYPMGEAEYISFRWAEKSDGTYSCTAVCGREEFPCTVTTAVRTEPTCTKNGSVSCSADGGNPFFSEKTWVIPKLAHLFTDYTPNRDATCTRDETETAFCSYHCGTADTRPIANTALGHSFTNYLSDGNATCIEDGTETAHCDRGGCDAGDTRIKEGSATGVHLFTKYRFNNDAACTKDGTETASCDYGCGETQTRAKANSALGHQWDAGTVTKAPTCSTSGIMTYTCTRSGCGETKTAVIPATGNHTYQQTGITKATAAKDGILYKKCPVCGKTAAETICRPKTATLSSMVYTYSGKVKNPTVTVRDRRGNRISSANYTAANLSGHKNVGTYKVTVKFKGARYSGILHTSFQINPKAAKLKSLSASSRGFTARWSAVTTQASGYQLQYATSSKFTNTKTVTAASCRTTSKKVTKLRAKKKYYVRIRTYKTVSGKKYYSAWSSVRTVTTKK